MVIDTNDLTDVANRLRNILLMQDTDRRLSEPADAVAIHEALSGRFLPQREALLSVEAQVARHDEIAERLSAEQAKILDVVQLLHRVEVRGGAGSGKTWLAVEQARRLAKAGKRVALISYSRGLAEWMRRRVSTFSHNQQPAYVGTFHGIGKAWGAPDGSDDDSDFWESELPEIMLQLANEQPTANLYDAIVIDEAQDFADSWWPVVLACLKYDDDALYVFSDEGQRIFPRFGDAPGGPRDARARSQPPQHQADLADVLLHGSQPHAHLDARRSGGAVRALLLRQGARRCRRCRRPADRARAGSRPTSPSSPPALGIPSRSSVRRRAGSRTGSPSGTRTRCSTATSWGSRASSVPLSCWPSTSSRIASVRESGSTSGSRERGICWSCAPTPQHIEKVGGPAVLKKIGGSDTVD